jgi:hypothetical protein
MNTTALFIMLSSEISVTLFLAICDQIVFTFVSVC